MIRWTLTLFAALIALHDAPVAAQGNCGNHASMMAQLDRFYGEDRLGVGLTGPDSAVEVWTSQETGTWTILEVFPNGAACVRASGKEWHNDPPAAPGDPA